MNEFSSSDSDDDDDDDNDDDNLLNIDERSLVNTININDEIDDVDDDELEQLARINAKFNLNHLTEKPKESKGIKCLFIL